jgi:hypothetical protein
MKCDGLPDPACVRQLNTYLSLWRQDGKDDIHSVLQSTVEVLPIMASLESILENPDEWEVPIDEAVQTRSYKAKIQARNYHCMRQSVIQGVPKVLNPCRYMASLKRVRTSGTPCISHIIWKMRKAFPGHRDAGTLWIPRRRLRCVSTITFFQQT